MSFESMKQNLCSLPLTAWVPCWQTPSVAAAGFGAKAQDAQVLMQVLKLMIFACNRFSSKHLKHVVQNLRHSYTLCQHGNSMLSARVLQARNQSQSKLPLLSMWGTSTCWPKGCKANLCITRKHAQKTAMPRNQFVLVFTCTHSRIECDDICRNSFDLCWHKAVGLDPSRALQIETSSCVHRIQIHAAYPSHLHIFQVHQHPPPAWLLWCCQGKHKGVVGDHSPKCPMCPMGLMKSMDLDG